MCFKVSAVQKRLKMALDRQKEALEKRHAQQQNQQKQADGLVPRMKVSPFLFSDFLPQLDFLVVSPYEKLETCIVLEDFIVQKTIFHKYNYEPSGLGNYTIYGVYAKK